MTDPKSGIYLNGFEVTQEVFSGSKELKAEFVAKQCEYAKGLVQAIMQKYPGHPGARFRGEPLYGADVCPGFCSKAVKETAHLTLAAGRDWKGTGTGTARSR